MTNQERQQKVAEYIKATMQLLDLSPSEYARRHGVHASHVNRWITRNIPRDQRIIREAEEVANDKELKEAKENYEKMKEKYKRG